MLLSLPLQNIMPQTQPLEAVVMSPGYMEQNIARRLQQLEDFSSPVYEEPLWGCQT